ncbi:MAG: WbqC family protein [Deltaproteobacteria bacterium]|nr:WbqC family protein [Deltaproteobacteria bacterium]
MIVSVHQPQYLPWLGYFDKVDRADAFVLLDNVQFKKNEWQNRNKIKTAQGWMWLTVPVLYKFPQLINEVGVNNTDRWQHKQRQALVSNYRKSPFWQMLEGFFEDTFSCQWTLISELNVHVVKKLIGLLGIETPVHVASEMGTFPEDPDERLIALTKYLGGDTYLAGSGGKDYMDLAKYEKSGIRVIFQEYHHPTYGQLYGQFEPYMSAIDLLYNHGEKSLDILRGNGRT